MVPDTLHDFFIAGTGASAALIGLLFVAISVAPERVFGSAASGGQLSSAGSAFIILANGFFISLGGLLPSLNIGYIAILAGIIGLINTIFLIVEIRQRGFRKLARGLVITVASLIIYGLEIWWGSLLLAHPGDVSTVYSITYTLLGGYAIGLRRAWELVGGRDYSIVAAVLNSGQAEREDTGQVAAPLHDAADRP